MNARIKFHGVDFTPKKEMRRIMIRPYFLLFVEIWDKT